MSFLRQSCRKLSYYSLRTHAFSKTWSLPVTWQRWWSYRWISHTWKPHGTRKPHGAVFYRPGATGDRSFQCRNRTFLSFCSCDLDLNPMTFLYELDPYSREIHRMCKYELPTSRLWKVIVWQTYTQSDKLRVVTSGHVTKMAVTPFDPPYSKPNAARKLNNLLYLLQKRSYGWSKFTLR